MKQIALIAIAAIAAAATFTSCKSSEANYRAAYDTTIARQREKEGIDSTTYARIEAERTANTAVVEGDSVRMVADRVSIVDGTAADLKPFGVVVGEYKQLFNARSFRNRLQAKGHPACVAKNSQSTYYVIARSFDTAPEAAAYLDTAATSLGIRLPIPKPWILKTR